MVRFQMPFLAVVFAILGLSGLVTGQDIPKLIGDLGSVSFDDREKASKKIESIGTPALEGLRKALKSEDAEIRKRAEELIARIESNSQNQKLMSPTLISINLKDATLSEVVAELVKQSGYRIVIQDRKGELSQKKLSISVEKQPFWKVLDLVCEKGGVVELASSTNNSFSFGIGSPPINVPFPRIPKPPVAPRENDGKNKKIVFQPKEEQPQLPPGIGALPPFPGANRQPFQGMGKGTLPVASGVIILGEGKRPARISDTSTAYRIRVMEKPSDRFGAVPAGRLLLGLVVDPEPRLKLKGISSVRVEKATDDRGQELEHDSNLAQKKEIANPQFGKPIPRALPVPGVSGTNPQTEWENKVPIYLIKAGMASAQISQLKGTMILQVNDEVKPLLEAKFADQETGKKIDGKFGGWIKVNEWTTDDKGSWKVRFEWELPEGFTPANQIAMAPDALVIPGNIQNPGGNPQIQIQQFNMNFGAMRSMNANGFEVLDEKGMPVTIASQSSRYQQNAGGSVLREMTIQGISRNGQPKVVLFRGSKTHTVEVPFELKNIPLDTN